jgi:hypothetical protein
LPYGEAAIYQNTGRRNGDTLCRVPAGSVENRPSDRGPGSSGLPGGTRLEAIRRSLASTTDPAGRGRLRVRLADALTAAGDLVAAATELKQAVAEAPATVGLVFGVRSLAARLPPEGAKELLTALGRADANPSAPSLASSARGGLGKSRPSASARGTGSGPSTSGVPAARLGGAAATGA